MKADLGPYHFTQELVPQLGHGEGWPHSGPATHGIFQGLPGLLDSLESIPEDFPHG